MLRLNKKINSTDAVKKIIVFRTGAIGDAICSLPAIYAIRTHFRLSEIHLLTSIPIQHITATKMPVSMINILNPFLFNKVINYEGIQRHKLMKDLKKENYDLFIELTQPQASLKTNIRNILIAKFLRVKYGFGWMITTTYFLKKYQEKYYPFQREVDRFLTILRKNGVDTTRSQYLFNITTEDKDVVNFFLNNLNINDKSKNISIAIGTKRQSNQWPLEYFKEVVKFLIHQNFNVLIIGGSEDQEAAKSFLNLFNVFDLTGKFSPNQSLYLISNCVLTISNDTGPMHMSYAMGTPVIGIFSQRNYPEQWYPPENGRNFVFRNNDAPCSICLLESCPNNNYCTRQIHPKEVIAKIKEIFALN